MRAPAAAESTEGARHAAAAPASAAASGLASVHLQVSELLAEHKHRMETVRNKHAQPPPRSRAAYAATHAATHAATEPARLGGGGGDGGHGGCVAFRDGEVLEFLTHNNPLGIDGAAIKDDGGGGGGAEEEEGGGSEGGVEQSKAVKHHAACVAYKILTLRCTIVV